MSHLNFIITSLPDDIKAEIASLYTRTERYIVHSVLDNGVLDATDVFFDNACDISRWCLDKLQETDPNAYQKCINQLAEISIEAAEIPLFDKDGLIKEIHCVIIEYAEKPLADLINSIVDMAQECAGEFFEYPAPSLDEYARSVGDPIYYDRISLAKEINSKID